MNTGKYYAPFIISMLVGFSSLSTEVLWVRVLSFSLKSVPQAFSYVLIVFLFGIATGSLLGKKFCASKKYDLYAVSSIALLLGASVDITSLHLLNSQGHYHNTLISTLLIFLTASLKSIVFPIAHHLGSNDSPHVARSVSYVYFGNILGSTLGPLVTGFIFLAYLTTPQAFYAVGFITMLSVVLSFKYADQKVLIAKYFAPITLVVISILMFMPNENLWYRLFQNGNLFSNSPDGGFKNTIESHYGVINVEESDAGDVVYGFGMYDGRINTKLSLNSNWIDRAYRAAGFHNNPKDVLIIGLSSGSWANVISWLPDVQNIDVVEIDPGYLELVNDYQEVSEILNDERFSFYIDDGRRWLNRHPGAKYDFILMNTSFHFRNNITNLLSKEFFQLIKSRLNTGGIFYFNTTGSPEAFKTVSKVFSNALLYRNFVVASDAEILLSHEETIARLMRMKNKHGQIFDIKSKDMVDIEKMLDMQMLSFDSYKESIDREIDIITDNNPVSEYKHGYIMNQLIKSDHLKL